MKNTKSLINVLLILVVAVLFYFTVTTPKNNANVTQQLPAAGGTLYSTQAESQLTSTQNGSVQSSGIQPIALPSSKIFLLGGYQGENITRNIVDYADVWSSTDGASWTQLTANAPWGKREGQAALYFKNKLWVISGKSDIKGYNTPEKNDVWSSTDGINWKQEIASAPWRGRKQFGATVFNNQMWIYGGTGTNQNDGTQTFFDDMWKSADGIAWTKVNTDLPATALRYDFPMITFNNKMWIFGGASADPGIFFNDVWSSSDGISWKPSTTSAPWSTRQSHSAVAFGGKMYVIGGWNDTAGYLNDVWSSSDGISWTKVATGPFGVRGATQAVSFNNKLWILGGGYDTGALHVTLNDIWSSINGSTWLKTTNAASWLFREYHSVVATPPVVSSDGGQIPLPN